MQKQTFRQVSEILQIFGNLWKSLEIFRSLQKKSENVTKCSQDDLPAFPKFFMKSLEVIRNLRNSSDVFRNLWKMLEICRKLLKITLYKLSEVFGNLQKSSEKIGKCRKVFKMIFRHVLKIFENFLKCLELFGNARKTLETLGKFLNVIRGL